MVALLILVASLVLAYCAYRILKQKLTDELTMAERLAAKFKWQFVREPNAQAFADIAYHLGFQTNALQVPYFISGNRVGQPFELFLFTGPTKVSPTQRTGDTAIEYATVIRTHEILPLHIPARDKVSVFPLGDWNYIVYGANATTEPEVLRLLALLGA